MPLGSCARAALSAACTSRAAPSMSRDRSNCSTTLVDPAALDEVISVTPAMRPSWRSSGVATAVAIVSGLAPGNEACTEIVGISTCGNGDTGSSVNATMPTNAMPIVSNVVATGRRMNGSDRLVNFMTMPTPSPPTVPSLGERVGVRGRFYSCSCV